MIENDADCPPSYCRVRLPSSKMKAWNEFINTNGFLRRQISVGVSKGVGVTILLIYRDKVQTQLVKLLAEAARNENPLPPRSIDESVLCSLPGKIVDAVTLHHILKIQSFEQLYYGQGRFMNILTKLYFPKTSFNNSKLQITSSTRYFRMYFFLNLNSDSLGVTEMIQFQYCQLVLMI